MGRVRKAVVAIASAVAVAVVGMSLAIAAPAPAAAPGARQKNRPCNGHVELCSRRLDQVTLGAAHNAYANAADEFGEVAQTLPVRAQLEAGVRALLLDVYHQLNVVPMSLAAEDLLDAFVVGGGYKYCQLGEGNCFLRLPSGCDLRPIITGWYSEFGALESAASSHRVAYGSDGDRFAATKRIQLRRSDSTGQERLYIFNYKAVERGGAIQSMITLREGDVIIVPERRLFE